MTDIIEGASVSIKTMADGTLRLTVDIEPRNAQAAFALFGAPGRAMALAALKDGAGAASNAQVVQVDHKTAGRAGATPETGIPVTGKPKGGEWAKLAGMWCADPDFWRFASENTHCGILWYVDNPQTAKEFVCEICGIESRAELDHSESAFGLFNDLIRFPFMAWMKVRGIQK